MTTSGKKSPLRVVLVWMLLGLLCNVNALDGSWEVLLQNAGISTMHAAVTRFGTVVLLDRTNIGASQINLPNGRCRDNPDDQVLKHDCTAHSVEFNIATKTVRPLFIYSDTWCSSGQFLPDGTLEQTGGDFQGTKVIRRFVPCAPGGTCDWVELATPTLQAGRWYASNQLLPDGRQAVVGGRGVFTVEYLPANGQGQFPLQLLVDTNDFENDNYYPYVHLLPNGHLFIFANRDSIEYNWVSNTVVRKYPTIPGEPRNYPSAGSSVMLPLVVSNNFQDAQVLVCGGAQLGAFRNSGQQLGASQTCGRMVASAANPAWAMETMPFRRTMGDMILLPTRDVLIINGAQNGSQGWGFASNPALNPVLYRPSSGAGKRFVVQTATTIPRVYHSTANLLPDGRVLLAGSNTHQFYTFTGAFPTELRLEAFSPAYLAAKRRNDKPTITFTPAFVLHGQAFNVEFTITNAPKGHRVDVNLLSAPYATHSYNQGQRCLNLGSPTTLALGGGKYRVTVTSPPNANIAPPAYYMVFVINNGVPSVASWMQIQN